MADSRARNLAAGRVDYSSRTKHHQPECGDKYGQLTVVEVCRGQCGGIKSIKCRCSCGRVSTPARDSLVSGKSTRCNVCAKKASGKAQTYKTTVSSPHKERLLDRICAIVSRCETKPTEHYGQRGIRVWSKWVTDRVAFLEYLATLPGWDIAELEIDRIDNDKGYEPGNLRFVTRLENLRNSRHPKFGTLA
ncbi:MAG: hypothetical protein IMZ53_06050 [Thermoplasmata archaeon]|nr:hypothetical protein [Thermoplasmata archaeon]